MRETPKSKLIIPMLARSPYESHRSSTTLELFFDLVFVVAIAQVSASLHHGIAEAHFSQAVMSYLMVFFGIWWAWMNFTWFASAYDTDDVPYRLMVFVQIVGALILAAGVPEFEGDLTLGVLGYVVMRLAMIVQWLRAAQADPQRRVTAQRYALGIGLCQTLWVMLLFVPQQAYYTAFILAVLAELLVPLWAERAEPTTWHPHHMTERYGLFTIIVLGEAILSLSLGIRSVLDEGNFSATLIGIIVGGLLILFSMWWAYFDRPMQHMLTSFQGVFLWGYGHYLIFASAAAVGAGLAVEIDYATHHAEISAVTAGAAVAIPVAIFLTVLWLFYGGIRADHPRQRFLVPVAVVLILTMPFWGEQTALWVGLIMAGLLAYKLMSRQNDQDTRQPTINALRGFITVPRFFFNHLPSRDLFTHDSKPTASTESLHSSCIIAAVLSGDNPRTAEAVAKQLKINNVSTEVPMSNPIPLQRLEEKLRVDSLESSQPRPDFPREQRRLWTTTSIFVAVLVAASISTAVFQFGLPWWMGAGDRNHVYKSEIGSLRYQVHLPPQYDGTTQLPVMVAIHGCGMTGYGWNSMKATTQFNILADSEGFIVVYPTQRMFRNPVNCWNSDDPREQHRYTGEPALLAGVAREVLETYNADPARVHVAGASSGAGTAVILAVTYPDVFATVASVAGGEYGLNQVDPDDPNATPPTYTARQAWAQMGERARQVPLLIIQGEDDEVVPPIVATRLVTHWTAVDDFVDDGLLNDSLHLNEETTNVPPEQGKHSYTHTILTTPNVESFLELYLVQDMEHVWPGPAGNGLYTDHAGPDASAIIWDFAKRHSTQSSSSIVVTGKSGTF